MQAGNKAPHAARQELQCCMWPDTRQNHLTGHCRCEALQPFPICEELFLSIVGQSTVWQAALWGNKPARTCFDEQGDTWPVSHADLKCI